ncbi:MAG: peptidylprolyl isomerase [Clostridia bacterium]|nr:peptidylprolyl isomerase [Clostridia bacterium]
MKKLTKILAAALIIAVAVCAFTACDKGNGAKPSDNPVATIVVKDYGTITVELYYDVAPNTVLNFISLANSGFYDGLTFHRVIKNFMIQGGDPNGDGTGGPGYVIKGEFTANGFENNLKHTRGVISMARRTKPLDSAGSQFFIMHVDYPSLDGQYASFGMVTEGMDVVDKIAATSTGKNDKPLTDVVIESIRVDTKGFDYPEPEVIK